MSWRGRRVVVTGGASFIGSHLTEALVTRGAVVRVVDNLSSGRRANLGDLVTSGAVELVVGDLLDPVVAEAAVADTEVVFHLAADHGGRGYIETHQSRCSTNMVLDGNVFRAAASAGIEKVVFTSSACVYPEHLMADPGEMLYLTEDLVGPPYCPDSLYGWAKLMGELSLRAYCREGKLKGVSVRYFPVYGPRCPESHAIIAWIARAFVDENPFEVWGTGEQIRNWTYVTEIAEATILAAERIDDGSGINLGVMERTRVIDAVNLVLRMTGKTPRLEFDPTRPTGPYNRSCDNRMAHDILGWQPEIGLEEGLRRTIEWYHSTHDRESVAADLSHRLLERT
jgi:nucleoside-diphosphate-sugar epimerase